MSINTSTYTSEVSYDGQSSKDTIDVEVGNHIDVVVQEGGAEHFLSVTRTSEEDPEVEDYLVFHNHTDYLAFMVNLVEAGEEAFGEDIARERAAQIEALTEDVVAGIEKIGYGIADALKA